MPRVWSLFVPLRSVVPAWVGPIGCLVLVQLLLPAYWQTVCILSLLAAVGSMSLTVLQGWAGVPSLATAAFLLIGGYSAAVLGDHWGFPLLLVVAITIVVGMALGVILSLPARRLSGLYLVLASLAFNAVVGDLGNLFQGATGATGGYALQSPSLFGWVIGGTGAWVWTSGIAALLVYHFYRHLRATRFGRGAMAMSDDRAAAAVAGINVPRYDAYVWAITSGLIAASGALIAFYTQSVSYDSFGLLVAVNYVVMIVLGGVGSLGGAVFGAFVITAVPIALQQVLATGSATGLLSQDASYIESGGFAILGALVLVLAPGGGADLVRRGARAAGSRPGMAKRTALDARAHAPEGVPSNLPQGDQVVEVSHVRVLYEGGVVGVDDATFGLAVGTALAVFGANGAGKTTLLSAIGGFSPAGGGKVVAGLVRIHLEGKERDVTRASVARRVSRGVILVPADDKVFPQLTCQEQLREARRSAKGRSSVTEEEQWAAFPVLATRRNAIAGTLSGGERQQLALAVALARAPRVLLVDEASLGLAPTAILAAGAVLGAVAGHGVGALIIAEQNLELGLRVADQTLLLENGRVVGSGSPGPELEAKLLRSFTGVDTDHAVRSSVRKGADTAPTSSGREEGLTATSVSVEVAGVQALLDVNLTVERGCSVGIIGGNGAGKTSLLNAISGYYRLAGGTIAVGGINIQGLHPYEIAALGVARSYQSVNHIRNMKAVDWVATGFEPVWQCSLAAAIAGTSGSRAAEAECLARSWDILRTAELEEYGSRMLSSCPYGVRKMVDLLRVLVREPGLLLLDEPTSGLSRANIEQVRRILRPVCDDQTTTIVVVDHDMRFVGSICGRLVALSAGRIIADGAPRDVLMAPSVVDAIVGGAPGARYHGTSPGDLP